MLFVSVHVDQKIIDVNQFIQNVTKNSFHEPLETGWTTQESHWRCDPMELTLAWNGKGCQFLRVFVQLHLPESGSEVQSGENCGVGPADVADTFGDFLY
jgi:hypothetical protein